MKLTKERLELHKKSTEICPVGVLPQQFFLYMLNNFSYCSHPTPPSPIATKPLSESLFGGF